MTRNEALQILGLDSSANKEEIKKAYKKLSVKHHPDKFPNASPEEKEKLSQMQREINMAYQNLDKPEVEQVPEDFFENSGMHVDLSEILRQAQQHFSGHYPFAQQRIEIPQPINLTVQLTFEESVLGTVKNIKYTRNEPCNACAGRKVIFTSEPCEKCNGSGMLQMERGRAIFRSTCPTCRGLKKKYMDCETCQKTGICSIERDKSLKIPAGVSDKIEMHLRNEGNFIPDLGYQELVISFEVTPHLILKLDTDQQVTCDLHLSLLEALQGGVKEVPTVHGNQEIIIPPRAKHLDAIIISGAGVPPEGDQVIVLHIDYPENLQPLIESLQNQGNNVNQLQQ